MPNWVYNNVTITGSSGDLKKFAEKASKPYTTINKGKRYQDETTKEWKYDADVVYEQENTDAFSFWNFIEPEDKEAYFADAHGVKPEGYAEWTLEQKMAFDLKFTGNGWYDWNVREWGTKWDASEVDFNDNSDDKPANLYYSFSTAWSIPEPVFRAMVEQHPELHFSFYSEEEQGWGAEFESTDSEDENGKPTKSLSLTKEWDIPDSHADYVELGRDCWACESGDEDDLYEDCPRSVKTFEVVVTRTYLVQATNAEEAWGKIDGEIVNAEIELPDGIEIADEDTAFVKDGETGERLFPISLADQPKECNHKFVPRIEFDVAVWTQCVFCGEIQLLDTAGV